MWRYCTVYRENRDRATVGHLMHALKLKELGAEETYAARRSTGINCLFVSGRKN
jgi:hypothetical protein